MKIITLGQKWLGLEALKLAEEKNSIAGVVSYPGDRLTAAAYSRKIPILALTGQMEWPEADLGLAAHFHHRIPKPVLKRFRHGVVGYHPSLLPKYKGKRAIEEAIAAGETETGGTLYQLDENFDGGPIIKQSAAAIRPEETPSELWRNKLAPLALKLFREYLDDLSP